MTQQKIEYNLVADGKSATSWADFVILFHSFIHTANTKKKSAAQVHVQKIKNGI